jgi:Ulp1 family protease
LDLVELTPEVKEQVYFFNAFFFPKLLQVEDQVAACKRPNLEEMYKPVFKWVKSINIFDVENLLIPIVDK